MPVITTDDREVGQEPFEVRSLQLLRDLREAFLGLIHELPSPIRRATDLEQALGVSATLGWQIYRVATSSEPCAAAPHVPGAAAVKHAMKAARKAGASEECVREVAETMETFEAYVRQQAGSREVFNTMVNSIAGTEEAIDLKTRRQAFRANSLAWGLQVRTFMACGVLHPGSTSDEYDILILRGLRDVRRLRAGAPFRLSSQRIVDGAQRPTESHAVDALDSTDKVGPKLLAEYCSTPCPELETRIDDDCIHTYVRETPLGAAGAQTFYLADLTRDVKWRSETGAENHHIRSASMMRPTETLVLDTLIHKGMFGVLEPKAAVFGSLDRPGETDPYRFRPEDKVPLPACVQNLGTGSAALATPHVPRYRHMLESLCKPLGWDLDSFELFRCVVEYPLLNTTVMVRFSLPEFAGW